MEVAAGNLVLALDPPVDFSDGFNFLDEVIHEFLRRETLDWYGGDLVQSHDRGERFPKFEGLTLVGGCTNQPV